MNAPENIAEITRLIPIKELAESASNPRKHFDKADLAELADSIKQFGILQPILVRELAQDGSTFEIVAGHRRFLAAKKAGLKTIPATVRELTDEQVLEIQLIENIQRKDVHPLDEAYAFDNLAHLTGWSVQEICAKVSKSKSYVYQRMALLDLCDAGKEAFFANQIETSVALLIARVPMVLQARALKTILNGWQGKPMGYRSAKDIIERQFMLNLDQAVFDIKDAKLTDAGSCIKCPKRSGANPDLFGDIESGDMCTDPTCFDDKRAAHFLALRERALKNGVQVIEGTEAKKVMPAGIHSLFARDFVALDDFSGHTENGEEKTYRELLGKKAPVSAIIEDTSAYGKGRFIEVVKNDVLKEALKKAGITGTDADGFDDDAESDDKESAAPSPWVSNRISNKQDFEADMLYRLNLYMSVRETFKQRWESPEGALAEFRQVTKNVFWQLVDGFDGAMVEKLAEFWSLDVNCGQPAGEYDEYTEEQLSIFEPLIDSMDATQLGIFLLDVVFVPEAADQTWRLSETSRLLKCANRLGIDAKAIEEDAYKTIGVAAEQEAQEAA